MPSASPLESMLLNHPWHLLADSSRRTVRRYTSIHPHPAPSCSRAGAAAGDGGRSREGAAQCQQGIFPSCRG